MSVYGHPVGVACVIDADVVYLAPLPSGPIQVLNGTGALVWGASAGRDVHETVALVAEETGASPQGVQSDVLGFLAQLVAAGLLELS